PRTSCPDFSRAAETTEAEHLGGEIEVRMRIPELEHGRSMGPHDCDARVRSCARIAIICGLMCVGLAGCGTLPNGRRWGQDVTRTGGGEGVGRTDMVNLKDPNTWVPIAGAGLLQIRGLDREISDWARENTPVFGSTENATDASDNWRGVSYALWFST